MEKKVDYEKLLSKAIGRDVSLIRSPYVEIALDVDSEQRAAIFDKAYQQIENKINSF